VDDFWGFYSSHLQCLSLVSRCRFVLVFRVQVRRNRWLLFYLLYSFVPTKQTVNKQKEKELTFSTLLQRYIDKFIVLLCICLVISCKVAPLNILCTMWSGVISISTVDENENKYRRPPTDLCIFISKFVHPAGPPFASRASLSLFCSKYTT
jgi:hypothetical protein